MKLQLKRSNVLDGGKAKEPTPPFVEYGELCVNYNVSDPALFIKDSNDNIIRIAGKNSIGIGGNPSGPDNPSTGNNIGDVFFNTGDLTLYYWDGSDWVPIASGDDNGFWSRDPDNGHLYPTYLTDKVGIGTNSPSGKLDVQTGGNESVVFDSAGSTSPRISLKRGSGANYNFVNDSGVYRFYKNETIELYRYASDNHTWITEASGEVVRIQSNGNVGIGTTNPQAKLQANKGLTTGVYNIFKINTYNGTSSKHLEFTIDNQESNDCLTTINSGKGGGATPHLAFAMAGSEVMRLNRAGNVGIGTDSPIDNLEVKGYATIGMPDDNWQKGNGTYIATKNGYLGHHGSNAVDLVCNGYRTGSGWKSLSADEGGSMIRLQRDGTIRFHGQPGAITGTEPATRMYIKSNGDVGIGKTSPTAKLDVGGKIRSHSTESSDNGQTCVTKDYLSSAGSGGSGAFGYWTRSGTNLYNTNLGDNVGIGTDSPNLRLSVTGPRKAAFTDFPFCVEITSSENFAQGVGGGISFRGKDTASNVSDFGFIAGVKENATSGNYAGALILGSRAAGSAGSGHEKMRIASNGNVGIGTTNPGKKLDVNGEGRVKDIFTVTGGGAKVICGENGAVGLSCNDGGGNANVTFNHMGNKADQDGNAARIVVNTDASTNPTFDFILYEGVTSGTEGTKVHPLVLKKNGAKITGSLEVTGKATSASTASSDGGKTLVTKDYLTSEIDALEDVYVNIDGDTMTGDLTVPSLNGGQLAGFRNQLINGDFSVWQRGYVVNDTGYGPDRWRSVAAVSGGTVSEWRRRMADNCEECPVACEVTSTGGNQDYMIQAVELPNNGNPGRFGIGSVWTLSFWANVDMISNWHQDNVLQFRDAANGPNDINAVSGGNDPAVVIETSKSDPAWKRYAVQNLVIDQSPLSTNICLSVRIPLPVGSVRIGQIQLEPGPVATPFEHRPIGTELALCQRYFIRQELGGRIVSESSGMIKTGNGFDGHIYPYVNVLPPMRDVGGATNLVFDVSSLQCATRPNTVNGSSVVRTARLRQRGTGGHYQISLGCTNAPANSEFFVGMGGSYTVSAEL